METNKTKKGGEPQSRCWFSLYAILYSYALLVFFLSNKYVQFHDYLWRLFELFCINANFSLRHLFELRQPDSFHFVSSSKKRGQHLKLSNKRKPFFFSLKRNSSPFYAIALAKIQILAKWRGLYLFCLSCCQGETKESSGRGENFNFPFSAGDVGIICLYSMYVFCCCRPGRPDLSL